MFLEKEGKLIYSYDGETVCIEAWGKDALRVRATKNRSFTGRDWAHTQCAGSKGRACGRG